MFRRHRRIADVYAYQETWAINLGSQQGNEPVRAAEVHLVGSSTAHKLRGGAEALKPFLSGSVVCRKWVTNCYLFILITANCRRERPAEGREFECQRGDVAEASVIPLRNSIDGE